MGLDAGEGDGGAAELAVGEAGDEVGAEGDFATGEMVFAGAEAGGGDGVGDEDGAFEAGAAEVVL